MHDPLTLAFSLPGIDIWHVDPELRGDDNSCDWFNTRGQLTDEEKAVREATWDVETLLDNRPHYPDSPEHLVYQPLSRAIRGMLTKPSRTRWWQVHPRWHFWHWRIKIHAVHAFKRWAWSRCGRCGNRFSWGYSPVSTCWDGTGPRWFRPEEHVYHIDCHGREVAVGLAGADRDVGGVA